MRIAIVAGTFPTLSETFVLNQVTGLIDRGHDVTVFADRAGDEAIEHSDVQRYELASRTVYWPTGTEALRELARHPKRLARALAQKTTDTAVVASDHGRFDAILCHFGHVGDRVRRLRTAGVLEGPLAVIFHAYDITVLLLEKGEDFYDELFSEAELLLPISNAWRERLVSLGAPPERVVVHHMGIDTQRFDCRSRSLSEEESVRLVMVARLVEKKGVGDAIRALSAARRRFDTDATLEIIGDGPLRDSLTDLADREEIADRVTFHGWLTHDQVAATLQSAHVLVAPSVTAENGDMEGIPVGIMEAMATGMPVISTYHSGIPELVEDDVTGYLCEEHDVGALAIAIRRMCEAPERWEEFGEAGRRKVEREFDIGHLNDRLVRLLSEIDAR